MGEDAARTSPPTLNPAPEAAEAAEARALDPRSVVAKARALLAAGDRSKLSGCLTAASRAPLAQLPDDELRRLLGGGAELGEVERTGRRAVITLGAGSHDRVVVLFEEGGRYRVDLATTVAWRPPDPGPRDPLNHPVPLALAVDGIPGEGTLNAILTTTAGEIRCRLFEQRAPRTVANFVALARGLRGFLDPKTGAWSQRPFYDGLTFHRVVAGRLIQGGDPSGFGRGGPGYAFADELDASLTHDRAGILSMANRGPNTNGSQFFITLEALPELDGHNAVFGACEPLRVLTRIAAAPLLRGERPRDPVTIESVRFERR